MSAFLEILSASVIVSDNEISAAIVSETLSFSEIDSVSKTFGSLETLSVNDRDSADSVMSASLEILSSSEIISERKTLTVPDKAIVSSMTIVSDNDMSADKVVSEILSVRDRDSDSGTVLIPALDVLSVSATESDM